MPNYKMVDADQLDSDLEMVAESIRSKAETSEKLAFPEGFRNAIDKISQGVQILRASGTFVPSQGLATVNCGFQPDVVTLHRNDAYNGFPCTCAVDFAGDPRGEAMEAGLLGGNASGYLFADIILSRTQTGFSAQITEYYKNMGAANLDIETEYVAVKFT